MTCKAGGPDQEEEIILSEDRRCEKLVSDLISSNIMQTNNTNSSGFGDTSQALNI